MQRVGERVTAAPPTLDGILAIRGVVETVESDPDEATRDRARRAPHRRSRPGGRRAGRHARARRARPSPRCSPRASTRWSASPAPPRPRRRARRRPSAAASPSRSRRCSMPPRRSIPTGCIRRPCCSPPRPTSARRSTASMPTSPPRASCSPASGGRPPARLPGAGIQPRGQHALLQVERPRADRDRPGAEGGGRPAARAGPERRMTNADVDRRDIARRGIMLVVSSPSGAGKTTLTRNLLEQEEGVEPLRLGDHAAAPRQRDRRRPLSLPHPAAVRGDARSGDLLEWAEVHGNLYGTPRGPVEEALKDGRDVLFDIDWQGTLQLDESMRADVVSVFVLPPSAKELKARLERRAEDSGEVIAQRLHNARGGSAALERIRLRPGQPRPRQELPAPALDPHRRAAEARLSPGPRDASSPGCSPTQEDAIRRPATLPQHWPARRSRRRRSPRPAASPRCRPRPAGAARRGRASSGSGAASCAAGRRPPPSPVRAPAASQASGVARGVSRTTDEVTLGGGVKARGDTSNRISASARQPASTPSRP